MTPTEIVETVEAMIDDCAATADAEMAERLSYAFERLSEAARLRSRAIAHRGAGNIEFALEYERAADECVGQAAGFFSDDGGSDDE